MNADLIARGISPFDPDGAALAAGEVMLRRIDVLVANRVSFGFETTLAARSLVSRFHDLLNAGYEVQLVFLWLRNADFAISRVADRVRAGGHDVPETTIRRRYAAGLKNFFTLYRPLATAWRVYNSSIPGTPRLIATGTGETVRVKDSSDWQLVQRQYVR